MVTHFSSKRHASAVRELLDSPQFRQGEGADVLPSEVRAALERLVADAERSTRLDKVDGLRVSAQELTTWRQQSLLPVNILELLLELQRQEAKRVESARLIAARKASIEATFNNQERLRENIKSLENVGKNTLTDRYLADLDQEEDELIKTRRAIAALEEEDAATKAMIEKCKLKLSLEVAKLRDEMAST
mmetsp:Transcript_17538/g.26416  ORF Transcript_17538/g.26416 Transcript_17538/m.26416 type:complete len:190 (+) Transcript_17538:270-839(+)